MKYSFWVIAQCLIFLGSPAVAETIQSKISLEFTNCPRLEQSAQPFAYDKSCIMNVFDNHPATKSSFNLWREAINKPVEKRLVIPDQSFIQYAILYNLVYGFEYENIQSANDPALLKAAQEALDSLPAELRSYIDRHFYGFALVSGTGWTGWATQVKKVDGLTLAQGSAIIINVDNIRGKSLNEWLTFREQTAFQTFSGSYKVNLSYSKIGSPSTLQENLRHFLIHETAHLISSAIPEVHPDQKYRKEPIPESELKRWIRAGQDVTKAFPFMDTSWVLEISGHSPEGEKLYAPTRKISGRMSAIFGLKKIQFYGQDPNTKFTFEEALVIYKDLNKTCFPSLYSMVNFTEDFAESVAHYFLTVREGYKYLSKIERTLADGRSEVVAQFKDDLWQKPECRGKLEFMKSLFGH